MAAAAATYTAGRSSSLRASLAKARPLANAQGSVNAVAVWGA